MKALESLRRLAERAAAGTPGAPVRPQLVAEMPESRYADYAQSSSPFAQFASAELRHMAKVSLTGGGLVAGDDPQAAWLEARIGQVLWAQGKPHKGRSIHVLDASNQVLAICDGVNYKVQVHKRAGIAARGALHLSSAPLNDVTLEAADYRESDAWSLIWRFGQIMPEALVAVPARFATDALSLRRMPLVSVALLQPRHLMLIRLFASGPRRFEELLAMTGMDRQLLQHDVAALYLVRSLSCVVQTGATEVQS
jgi:hypothetical protein